MKKLRTEYKVLVALCLIVTIMGGWHLIYISALQSLVITIIALAWFVAIDTPYHDKYIIEDDPDFRNR